MEHNEVVVTMIRLDLRKPHATPDLSNHWQQSLPFDAVAACSKRTPVERHTKQREFIPRGQARSVRWRTRRVCAFRAMVNNASTG